MEESEKVMIQVEYYHGLSEILAKVRFVDSTIIRPPYIHRRRIPQEYIMYLIKDGIMYLEEEGRALTLKKGDICILDKNREHYGIKTSKCEYFYVHFQKKDLVLKEKVGSSLHNKMNEERKRIVQSERFSYELCDDNQLFLPKKMEIDTPIVYVRLLQLLEEAKKASYSSVENSKIICACKLQEFFVELTRYYTKKEIRKSTDNEALYPQKVQEMIEWIDREYAMIISSELIEEKFNCNFDYLNRKFKYVTGVTIFQYLKKTRISHAKKLIENTSMSMKQIGLIVGYPDEFYFSKVFKKSIGVAPSVYEKNYKVVAKIQEKS